MSPHNFYAAFQNGELPAEGYAGNRQGAFMWGWGADVGQINSTTKEGFSKGAFWFHTDGATGDDMWYVNTGTSTTASWTSVASVGGSDFGASGILADVVAESTSATGVTVDGVLLKDAGITATGQIDIDRALTGTGDGVNIAVTMSHATQVAEGLDVSIAQITNVRTSGSITAIKASITSLTGTTAGVDHIAFEGACTAGDADSDHILLKQGANFTRTIDSSAAATGEAVWLAAANVAAALTVKEASLTFEILKTTTATPGIDWTFALTAAEQALHLTTTANLASGAISGITSQIATVTTVHTAGVIAAFKASITSLAGDTGGDFAALHIVSVDGGGTTPTHVGIYCDDPLDALIKVAADGDGGFVVGATMTISPEAAAESGYIRVAIGATIYQVPIYAE